ncbi:MAG: helix-turn-helix domain-containing protein, partial [Bacteroidota bacterium]
KALPEDNAALKERLAGAADYFLKLLTVELGPGVDGLEMMSDNSKILKTVQERHSDLQREIFVTTRLFQTIRGGFDPLQFVRQRADAGLDFNERNKRTKQKRSKIPKEIPHPVLYARLNDWRAKQAREQEVRASTVMKTATLLEINYVLPTNKKNLLGIKGFGATRYEQVGEVVLAIIREYTEGRDVVTDQMELAKGRKAKEDTKLVSLEMYKAGQDVAAIATARKLTEGTIQGHLAYWVKVGEVAATDFMEQKDLDYLANYFSEHPEQTLGETFAAHEEQYSYGQLRIGMAFKAWRKVTPSEE